MNILSFLTGHEALLASVAVAVLDLVFALNPKTEANTILHWVYLKLKGLGNAAK